jgi:osmotically-inducible protein OsmY
MIRTTRRFPKLLAALALIAVPPALSACSPTGAAVGAGATVAVAGFQERGLSGAVSDSKIRLQINDLWLQEDEVLYRKASLQVQNGRVLVTGVMPTEEMRAKTVELAWQADGVKEVINEIQIGEGSIGDYTTDTWISTQLKADLLLDAEVSSINYSIETVNGVVYLIGIAQSDQELERVLNHARGLANVRKVVSYVRVKTEPREPEMDNGGTAAGGQDRQPAAESAGSSGGQGAGTATGGSGTGTSGDSGGAASDPVTREELDAGA